MYYASRLRGLSGFGNAGMGDFLDTLNTYGSKASSLVNTGASIVNTVSNTGSSAKQATTVAPTTYVAPNIQPQVVNPNLPSVASKLSTAAKIGIGVGGAALVATVILLVTKKKKKG